MPRRSADALWARRVLKKVTRGEEVLSTGVLRSDDEEPIVLGRTQFRPRYVQTRRALVWNKQDDWTVHSLVFANVTEWTASAAETYGEFVDRLLAGDRVGSFRFYTARQVFEFWFEPDYPQPCSPDNMRRISHMQSFNLAAALVAAGAIFRPASPLAE
jgi:hypothetical protein